MTTLITINPGEIAIVHVAPLDQHGSAMSFRATVALHHAAEERTADDAFDRLMGRAGFGRPAGTDWAYLCQSGHDSEFMIVPKAVPARGGSVLIGVTLAGFTREWPSPRAVAPFFLPVELKGPPLVAPIESDPPPAAPPLKFSLLAAAVVKAATLRRIPDDPGTNVIEIGG